MRRVRMGLASLAVVLAALPANAHETDPNVFTRIDAITPQVPGLVVQIRAGVADQLFVVNDTTTTVEVLDSRGEPFLRIGPDDVQADFTSSDWYTSNSPLGLAQTPPPDTARVPWRRVATGNSWGWFDHRLHGSRAAPPPGARSVTKLSDWTIPMRHGGTDVVVTGHVEYRPVLGAFRTRVEKTPPGVTLDTLDGRVPGLFLRWQGSGTLTVKGIDGEPFARFTAEGVEVNDASATWQEDQRLRGNEVRVATGAATPDWTPAGSAAQLTWLDRRLAYAPGVPPGDALRSTKPTTVVEWDIPVEVDGAAATLQGTTTWVPNDAGAAGDTRSWVPIAVVVVAAVAAAVVARRRAER